MQHSLATWGGAAACSRYRGGLGLVTRYMGGEAIEASWRAGIDKESA